MKKKRPARPANDDDVKRPAKCVERRRVVVSPPQRERAFEARGGGVARHVLLQQREDGRVRVGRRVDCAGPQRRDGDDAAAARREF